MGEAAIREATVGEDAVVDAEEDAATDAATDDEGEDHQNKFYKKKKLKQREANKILPRLLYP